MNRSVGLAVAFLGLVVGSALATSGARYNTTLPVGSGCTVQFGGQSKTGSIVKGSDGKLSCAGNGFQVSCETSECKPVPPSVR